jgi:hypothetical protein
LLAALLPQEVLCDPHLRVHHFQLAAAKPAESHRILLSSHCSRPNLCDGMGWRFLGTFPHVATLASQGALGFSFLGVAFLLPITLTAIQLPTVVQGRLIPRNQLWVTQSVPEVEHAASWLNDRTSPSDLVIANVNIAWLLKARTADFLHATLWKEYPTEDFLSGISRERFRYPAELETAKYVVVGDIDQVWTFGQLSVDKLVEKISSEKWPVVWSGKYYVILGNPKFSR